MRPHSIRWMNRFVVETFEIDRVRAIDRDFSCIDIAANGTDESEVFVLIITAKRRGKQNQRHAAAITESEHLKFAAQVRRVPFDVAFVHRWNVARPSWLRPVQIASQRLALSFILNDASGFACPSTR